MGKQGPGKGKTNNPNGRPVGSKNKVNTEVKEKIEQAVLDNVTGVMKDFKALKGEKKVKYFIELAKIVLPRPKDPEEEEEINRRNNELLERLFPRRD